MTYKNLNEMIKNHLNEGESVQEIADNLGVSESTIYRHLKEIREEENEEYNKESDRWHKIERSVNRIISNKRQKFRFISTPTHGYLLVPAKIMDDYPVIKRSISDFSWVTDGFWYLEEDSDADLFMQGTKYTRKDIEYINSEDDIGLHVMSPHNPLWRLFYDILTIRLNAYSCDAATLKQSRFVLREFFPEIDIERSTKYFEEHGGFCDCEVLTNVEYSSDNIKKE